MDPFSVYVLNITNFHATFKLAKCIFSFHFRPEFSPLRGQGNFYFCMGMEVHGIGYFHLKILNRVFGKVLTTDAMASMA